MSNTKKKTVQVMMPPAWTITWESVLPLGIDDAYYRLDCWLDAESVEGEILERLDVARTEHDARIIWRAIFIADLNNWTMTTTARNITNRLDLRCFVRLLSLRSAGPHRTELDSFVRRNATDLDWALRYLAAIWTNASGLLHITKLQHPRPPWVHTMDTWSHRIATTNRERRLPMLLSKG